MEIGSGSGEHGVVFQKRFPGIIWQTSDPELVHRKSISSWIEYEELTKKIRSFRQKNNSKILGYLTFLN